jgi:hypothetical protein
MLAAEELPLTKRIHHVHDSDVDVRRLYLLGKIPDRDFFT